MLFSSFLAITLTPVLMSLFIRQSALSKVPVIKYLFTIYPEDKHPVSRILRKLYEPVARARTQSQKNSDHHCRCHYGGTAYPFMKLGSEFMPPLYEGSLFYMPVTVPGASISEVSKLLQLQDRILKRYRKWRRYSERPVGPKQPLIRPRWRCSRPSSTLSRKPNGGRA